MQPTAFMISSGKTQNKQTKTCGLYYIPKNKGNPS